MKIAQHPKMLDIVTGYKIPFHSKLSQSKIPCQTIVSREKKRIGEIGGKRNFEEESYQKSSIQGNLFVSIGQETCTSSFFAFALV